MFGVNSFHLIAFFAGLSLVALLAMVATSFLKLVVVMGLIRNALGVQSIPPNMVLNALAVILSFYILAPVGEEMWAIYSKLSADVGSDAKVEEWTEIALKAAEPYRQWLDKQAGERERAFFVATAERLWSKDGVESAVVDQNSFHILIPSFCVSELSRAFKIGFLVYLPFIAIDIIVSNILLAMGMMMVSPVTISLPFKLLLFVMVDGWTLLIQGLVRGYMV
ncbi:MAG: type III secretion system export apparatus subunit SctR [Kiritimatiellae bacterium]|nr:type III secretion system export apparatus subunit SctR [Kiritimatiellia bacterium]